MRAANPKLMSALASVLVLICLLNLMNAINSDNMLRIVFAGVGLLAFGGLLVALLVARFKGLKA